MIESAVFALALGVATRIFLGSTTHRLNMADHFSTVALGTGCGLLLLALLDSLT